MPPRPMPQNAHAPSFRHFTSAPWYLREAFLDHVRRTSEPETFAGLHPGPLAKNEPFDIMAPFEVEAARRPNGDRAPCPMCHHPNKYLHGRLVYLRRLQAIAAIGCECADKETNRAALDGYLLRQEREQRDRYLLDHLHLVPAALAAIRLATPIASEVGRICRLLRNKGGGMRELLAYVNRNGGRLLLVEELHGDLAATGPRGFGSSGGRNTRDIDCGLLAGSTALLGGYDPVGELTRIRIRIEPFGFSRSPEQTLDHLSTAPDRDVAAAFIQLREAAHAYDRFQRRLVDAVSFFEQGNLQRVANWGAHPLQPHQFIVEVVTERGLRVLRMRGLGADVRAVLEPVIWQRPPDWPKPLG